MCLLGMLLGFVLGGAASQAQTPAPPVDQTVTPSPTPPPVPVFPITPGPNGIEGSISNALSAVRYTFDAPAGAVVTVTMVVTSGDLDPFLLLFDSEDQQLAFNDDAEAGIRNARIEMTLAAAGAYTVEATRFQQAAGRTAGTYLLTVMVEGMAPVTDPTNPLGQPPPFEVDFIVAAYGETQSGTLDETVPHRYFAIAGRQGDLVQVTMVRIGGTLTPQLRILNSSLIVISQQAQSREAETIAYATLPETGWYLVEAGRSGEGAGTFTLYVQGLAGGVLQYGQSVSGNLTETVPTATYIFNARIGDQVFITLTGGVRLAPRVRLLDLTLQPVTETAAGRSEAARLRLFIPRSGAYIIQITDADGGFGGNFELSLAGVPVDVGKIFTKPASYNNRYEGVISNSAPVDYYLFSGKAGDLISVQMVATSGNLDPYLILTDAQLNELAFNDNSGSSLDARITQFALPADGSYFILATRNRLASGTTTGSYRLDVSAGAISLQSGILTVTLEWQTSADLNLFVRDPQGRSVSWSTPQVPSGGLLQIDSNADCVTISDLPVEHIYWPGTTAIAGDYRIWVWYQRVCDSAVPVSFSLTVRLGGVTALEIASGDLQLEPNERLEVGVRLTEDGGTVILDPGTLTRPSPQQQASEGGDTRIDYGANVTGTLSNQVYARFYQFSGTRGDIIVVSVDRLTGDLDPVVVLRDVDDNNLASNDDADSSTQNARLVFTLPADGTYVIAVTRFGVRDGTTTGSYRLTLERGS